MNELLAVVLIILVVSMIHGYHKGFIKIIISFLSLVLTIWLVSVVTPYISDYLIENTQLYQGVKNQINEAFAEDNARYDNTIEENQIRTIHSYQVPDAMKNTLISNNNEAVYRSLMVSVFEDYISSFIARMVLNVLAFVCTFLMITIFLRMTFFTMEILSRIPVIKGLNKIAGLLLGLVEGVLIVWVIFLAATMFAGNEIGSRFFSLISQNVFLSVLYNCNILLKIIYSFLL